MSMLHNLSNTVVATGIMTAKSVGLFPKIFHANKTIPMMNMINAIVSSVEGLIRMPFLKTDKL